MAKLWSSSVEFRKDEKTRYLEENNIKDITKSDLKTLKSKLDAEATLETKLVEINDHVEKYFNWFLLDEWENTVSLTVDWATVTDSVKNIVMSGSQAKLDALANYVIDKSKYEAYVDELKDEEIKKELKEYAFELNDLRKEIAAASETWTGEYTSDHPFYDIGTSKEKQKYNITEDYVAPYEQKAWYANITEEMDLANIYKDAKMKKYLEEMFDPEDQNKIRKWMLKINIGVEDGLAWIIIAIREAITLGETGNADNTTPEGQLYLFLEGKSLVPIEEWGKLNITKDILKEALDQWLLTYDRKWWLDFEKNKIYKILSRAQRSTLDTFASLLQSKTDEAKAIKERHNAAEMLESGQINDTNVLDFLCDVNGDGLVSTAYKEKHKTKKEKNQWDVWTIFGQQIQFTIEQAIEVKTVELGDKDKAEQLVISNIIKNMEISDSSTTGNQRLLIYDMLKDTTKCTRANLANLLNGNADESLSPMPEFKVLFLDAISKINGGSEEVNPDLYDTLVGKDVKSVIDLVEDEVALKDALDTILQQSTDPEIVAMIREKWLVRVRQNVFWQIMNRLDNIEISTNDGKTTSSLQAAGVTKWWEAKKLKKELMETAIETIIKTGAHLIEGKLLVSLGYGRSGTSKSGKTKWARWVGGWAGIDLESGIVGIFVDLTGEVAQQYNYKKVINADLSKIKSAKYFGIEWWARANMNLVAEKAIDAEAYAGINRQQDPEVGINQIDKQYGNLSEEIFTIEKSSEVSTITADKESFKKYLYTRIENYKNDTDYGAFVTTNEQHLKDTAAFMVRYMAANQMFGKDSILAKKTASEQKLACNTLLEILQSWAREQRRADVIAELHNKVKLTKLSFGVTTNTLTMKLGKRGGKDEGEANLSAGFTTQEEDIPVGQEWSANEMPIDDTRLGICGLYVGLRISTWKNMYVPNEKQYLFTEYEMGQGIWAEILENPGKDLTKYAAYLEAIYNDDRLTFEKDTKSNKINVTFSRKWSSDLTLAKFLNIHATEEAKKNFSLTDTTMTIGNVWKISAYTITQANGVRRILSLGSEKLDETVRVTENTPTAMEDIKATEPYNKDRTQEKLKTDIIDKIAWTGTNLDNAKKDVALFFDADGKLTTPAIYDKKVTFTPETIKWNTVTSWELFITKKTDGTFLVTYAEKKYPEGLTVTYKDEKEYQTAYDEAIKDPANLAPEVSTAVTNLFTYEGDLLTAKTTMNTFLSSLEELEDNNNTEYSGFISAASMTTDGKIDATDITDAIGHLKTMMSKPKDAATLLALKTYLDGNDNAVKSYIVDRFKQILARETYLKKMTVGDIAKWHSGRDTVKWPSGTALDAALIKEMQAKKKTLQTTYAKTPYETAPTVDPNLIGYTAFYRQNITHAYSITSLGETGYQGELMTFDNKDLASTWFLNNFKTNVFEVDRLAKSLEAQFEAAWLTTISLSKDTTEETRTQINTLLTWGTITIDSWEKISIDLDWVFYLLGDCCNESIWMKIKNIKVQKLKNIDILNGTYSSTGTPEVGYKGWLDVSMKNHSISSRVETQELNALAKMHVNVDLTGKQDTGDQNAWYTSQDDDIPVWPPTDDENPFE